MVCLTENGVFSSWWKKRTIVEKSFVLLAISVLSLVVLLTIIFSVTPSDDNQTCLTAICNQTAFEILNSMNTTSDPCQNFYNFACGNYVQNTVLPPASTVVSLFTKISDQVDKQLRSSVEKPIEAADTKSTKIVKSLYQACMNDAQIEANTIPNLKKIFKETGGWPILEGEKWEEESFNWTSTLYKFMKQGLFSNVFFQVTAYSIEGDNMPRLLISPAYSELYKKGLANKEFIKYYYEYMVEIATIFGVNEQIARKEMKDVLDFDIAIANLTTPRKHNQSLEILSYMTVEKLESTYSYLPWQEYLNAMLLGTKIIKHDDFILLSSLEYLDSLRLVLSNTPKRILANYIYSRAIVEMISYLSSDLRTALFKLHQSVFNISKKTERWKECIATLREKSKGIHIASGYIYVKDFFKEEIRKPMLDLVNSIKSEVIGNLKQVKWMDGVTRQHALAKAEAMRIYIGYPDELLNQKEVDHFYENLTVSSQDYLQSMLNVTLFIQKQGYELLGQPLIKRDWKLYAVAVVTDAYYAYKDNALVFPAGILQDFFFDSNRPNYVNYGSVGYIAGHELTHAFDNLGRHLDKDGNISNWWKPQTLKSFTERAQCMVEQYSNISLPGTNITLNGTKSESENIADNGGVKATYLAYKNWAKNHGPEPQLFGLPYTPEQMFWISVGRTWCDVKRPQFRNYVAVADNHALSMYRVNVPLMNSEYFAKDFACPEGSPMNPKHKCAVW